MAKMSAPDDLPSDEDRPLVPRNAVILVIVAVVGIGGFIGYRAVSAKNQQAASQAYLTENQAKAGVVTLPSGLQYKVLVEGTGPKPLATDTVTVHYRGTLVDGTEFDSSLRRGTPASFPVARVIPGWTEALQRMPVGSKWELVIPADLAYGMRGSAPTIPPMATLIFEVELLGIGDGKQK